MKHHFNEREDGLLHCKVCGGGEGSLPTECPGSKMTGAQEDAVYAGTLNFVGGIWVVAAIPIGNDARQVDDAAPRRYAIVERPCSTHVDNSIIVSRHGTPEEREIAFETFLQQRAAAPVSDYVEYSFGEVEQETGVLENLELWAMHIPRGTIERESSSFQEIQETIRSILRDGGFVNLQMNRCVPREGSALKEPCNRKFIDALWRMKAELVKYPPPNREYIGLWGLPDVVPHICRQICLSAADKEIANSIREKREMGAGDAIALYDLPVTAQESFAAGFNECMRIVHAAGLISTSSAAVAKA